MFLGKINELQCVKSENKNKIRIINVTFDIKDMPI